MPIGIPKLFVDWNRSGSFTDLAYKDIAEYIVELSGQDGQPEGADEYTAGTMTAVLNNLEGYFSPRNTESIFRSALSIFDAGANTWVPFAASGADQGLAQSWRISKARPIDRIRLRLRRTGAPGGSVQLSLYRDDGTGKPGTLVDSLHVSSAVAISSIGTTGELVSFSMPTLPVITSGVTYHLVPVLTGYSRTPGTDELSWAMNGSSGYEGGHASSYNGTAWSWRNNAISNPSIEVNASGWSGINSTVLTRITSEGYDGGAALQVDPPGSVGVEGALFGGGAVAAAPATAYTFRIGIKGTAGHAYRLAWDENSGGGGYLRTKTSAALTLVGTGWNWFTLSATTGASTATVNLYIYHDTTNATRFYLDKAEFSADSAPAGDFKFEVGANDVRKKLPVWLYFEYDGGDYYEHGFFGYVDEWVPDADPEAHAVTMTATDPFKAWQEVDVNLPIQTNYRLAPDAVYNICNLVLGLTATQVSIGDDGTALPVWFTHNDKAATVLERLRQAGAAQHWIGCAAAPDHLKYRWRAWTYEATTTSVDETWGSNVESPQLLSGNQLVNVANVRAKPLVVQSTTDVWTYEPVPETWSAGESRTVIADLDYPCTAITSPASVTDYTAGFTVSVVATYAQKVVLSVTAPGGGGSLALLKLRGAPATPSSEITVTREDTDSQDAYDIVSPRDIDNELIQSWSMANGLAGRVLDQNSRELLRMKVTRKNFFPSQLQRGIGSRVNVTVEEFGVDGRDFFITGRTWAYQGTTLQTEYILREAPNTKEWFQWDVRTWDAGQWAPG